MKKKPIVLLSLAALVLLCFAVPMLMFFISPDVPNVNIEGHAYGAKDKTPLKDCKVVVFSGSYKAKGSNYTDYSSFLGSDTLTVTTDGKGYYSAKIDRSAYLYIRVFKEGFRLFESDGMNAKKRMKQDFYLEEGEAKESDLYKPYGSY